MAAFRSLRHIFESPLPENPTLLESLSLSQIKARKPNIEQSSFTEIFGEIHFKESSYLAPESKNHSKSLTGNESLQLCTEGLGFESSHDDIEELKNGVNENWEVLTVKENMIPLVDSRNGVSYGRRSRLSVGSETQYPPPISCIGKNGKPWVCFKSYRDNGRFVLKEIRMPTKKFLHAHRENGRLRLNVVLPDDEDEEEAAENEQESEEAEDEDSENGENDVDV